jgi:hypothetical protein
MSCPARKVESLALESTAAEPTTLDYATQADFDPCDKPVLWSEPRRRRSSVTVDEINKRNMDFWDKHEPPPPPPDPLAIIRADVMRAVARESAREAVRVSDAARRANGWNASAKDRAEANTPRNRQIHDLRGSGMKPKEIEGALPVEWKLKASQIRRVLKAPRP